MFSLPTPTPITRICVALLAAVFAIAFALSAYSLISSEITGQAVQVRGIRAGLPETVFRATSPEKFRAAIAQTGIYMILWASLACLFSTFTGV